MGMARTFPAFEQFLILLGSLKLLFVVLFFASFAWVGPAPAQTGDGENCTGVNLLEKLKSEDPQAHARILAEGEKTINAQSVFWKLERDGLKPSYLLGTMHLADPRIATIPADVRSAIDSSQAVVIESTEVLDPQAGARAMAALAHLTLLAEGSLRDLVADDLEDELEVAVTSRGLPMALADRMQPWLIATTVALPVCEFLRKQSGEKVLDNALAEFAQKGGKSLHGLETVAEQFTAIASLPVDYHVSALEETLRSGSIALDMIETMKSLYLDGKMGLVFPLMKEVMPASGSGKGIAEFQGALIDRRNNIMLERALPVLENETAVIAVGALHLPGETGLVKQFRDAGFRVTPMR